MVHIFTLNEHDDKSCRRLITMDADALAVSFDGASWARLSPCEFRIMLALMDGGGRPVSKHTLKAKAWGGQVSDDALNHRIKSLREKVGKDRILSTYGYGYRLR